MIDCKSYLRWVGSKKNILDDLLQHLPSDFYDLNYCEPFIGGGTLFFATQNKNATLCDSNERLITTYKMLRDNSQELLCLLKKYQSKHCEDYFYESRDKFNDKSTDPLTIASLFIYLNKTCYNGLFRVNRKNEFNTPVDKNKKVKSIVEEKNFLSCSKALQNINLICRDFKDTVISSNTFYYFDPPYHSTTVVYSKDSFNEIQQTNLRDLCNNIHNIGGKFIVSNSNTEFIKELYKDYIQIEVSARRSLSCKPDQRKQYIELLIKNFDN